MYKVEWKGAELDDPLVSWVPFDELECHDLIMKFEAKRGPPLRKVSSLPSFSQLVPFWHVTHVLAALDVM